MEDLLEWLKNYSVIVIPLTTVILGTIAAFIKEKIVDVKKERKIRREEQLIKLYNKIFKVYLMYDKLLDIGWEEREIDGFLGKKETVRILNVDSEKWNKAYEELQNVIYENLHLLEYHDMGKWHGLEYLFHEIDSQESMYTAYTGLLEFIGSAVDTYGRLYHDFHKRQKWKRKKK